MQACKIWHSHLFYNVGMDWSDELYKTLTFATIQIPYLWKKGWAIIKCAWTNKVFCIKLFDKVYFKEPILGASLKEFLKVGV